MGLHHCMAKGTRSCRCRFPRSGSSLTNGGPVLYPGRLNLIVASLHGPGCAFRLGELVACPVVTLLAMFSIRAA